jgi:hypothetical protein
LSGAEIQGIEPFRVKRHEQAALQFVGAGKESSPALIQRGGIRFVIVGREGENLAHGIDEYAKTTSDTFEDQNVLRATQRW